MADLAITTQVLQNRFPKAKGLICDNRPLVLEKIAEAEVLLNREELGERYETVLGYKVMQLLAIECGEYTIENGMPVTAYDSIVDQMTMTFGCRVTSLSYGV